MNRAIRAKVGILALQGCIEPHRQMLRSLGVEPCMVRLPSDLENIERLIIPGGESTTMLSLLERAGMFGPLQEFGRTRPVWGICAGAILISREVLHPQQKSLSLIESRAHRNYYGSQLDSFDTEIEILEPQMKAEVAFIRAPLLEPLSAAVEIKARHNNQAVFLQQKNVLATSFHIELGSETRLHEYFLGLQ